MQAMDAKQIQYLDSKTTLEDSTKNLKILGKNLEISNEQLKDSVKVIKMKKPTKESKSWVDSLREWHPYFTLCLCAYCSVVIFLRVIEEYYPKFHGLMADIISSIDFLAPLSGGNALDPTDWANYWQ